MNRLNETVQLSTQTYVKTDVNENIYNFTLKTFCLTKPEVNGGKIYFLISQPKHILSVLKKPSQ